MLAGWADSLVGVAAALSGVALAGWLQQRVSREAYQRAQEDRALELVAALMTALDDHRSAMWALRNKHHAAQEQLTRSGIPGWLIRVLARWLWNSDHYVASWQASSEELARTHQTRKAVSGLLTRLQCVAPSLGAIAEEAADATYTMHDSTDLDDLEVRRLAARDAARRLRAIAVERFQAAGIGLVLPTTHRGSESPLGRGDS